jgi:hypothetical protein
MDIKHITSHSLRRLLSLTDKKEQLIQAVSDIESEIAKTLKGAATTVVEVAEAVTPFKPAKKAKKGAKSGGLKSRVLALLEAAGDEGLKVKDIASKLGTKATSVSVWFSTTGKGITTKVAPGRYAKKGAAQAASAAPTEDKAAKPVKKARRTRIATSKKTRPAAKKAMASVPAKSASKKVAKKPRKKAVARPTKLRFKLPKKS